jgi:serpin B
VALVVMVQTPPEPVFRADHPFLLFIRDTHSGLILFTGRVIDPRR